MSSVSEPFDDGREAARTLHHQVGGGDGWYAGVTQDPDRRLLVHRVDPDSDSCAYVECTDSDVAREAERILHSWGYEGGTAGGSDSADWVFVYEISVETWEGG